MIYQFKDLRSSIPFTIGFLILVIFYNSLPLYLYPNKADILFITILLQGFLTVFIFTNKSIHFLGIFGWMSIFFMPFVFISQIAALFSLIVFTAIAFLLTFPFFKAYTKKMHKFILGEFKTEEIRALLVEIRKEILNQYTIPNLTYSFELRIMKSENSENITFVNDTTPQLISDGETFRENRIEINDHIQQILNSHTGFRLIDNIVEKYTHKETSHDRMARIQTQMKA